MAEFGDPITCEELVELATEYLEGSLPPETVELLERHSTSARGASRISIKSARRSR